MPFLYNSLVLANLHTSSNTKSSILIIEPSSSAIGINSSGEINPNSSSLSLTNASAELIFLSFVE